MDTRVEQPAGVLASAALYAEVQQFYARQMQHLDALRAAPFAATFAADGVFEHSPDSAPAVGRAGIEEEVRSFHQRRFAGQAIQRRHWFNMLDVREQSDGTLCTEFYALILTITQGDPQPVAAPSCLVRDVLVREDGELRTARRTVRQDHVPVE